MSVETSDIVAMHQVLGLYGHLVDDRDWAGLDAVFTADAVFDATKMGVPLLTGLREIIDHFAASKAHPLAHHITNIVVLEDPDGGLLSRSKAIAPLAGGVVGSVSYVDRLARTPHGLRVQYRTVSLRRESDLPHRLVGYRPT